MINGRVLGIFYSMSLTVALVFAALNAAGVTTVKENSYSIAALQKPVTLTEVR